MFFRRVFSKNQNNYNKEMFEETSSDHQSTPSPPLKAQKRRASIEEKQSRGLAVLQLTPLWEHIIRTNSMPRSVIISDVFEEFYERLHDPEWQVRQHALRVLVDVLIVMGQQADYHIQSLVHPLVDNLGHIAPAVRKGALDALRVYVAQTAMPETVMLDIMNYGMDRPVKDPFGGRMTVAVMLALPALILPILITPKRGYVVKAVMDALANKMVKITYQEIALKILLKIKDMVGPNEFNEYMPMNVKKDFDLLCKVYGLPKGPTFHDPNVDLHVPPAHDPTKPWASKFVPKKDIQGNIPSSHAPINNPESAKYFGGNYDATYPFERTRLSNTLGTPKRQKSPRAGSGGILRSSSDNSLTVDFNGNSSGSESGGSCVSLRTQNNTAANGQTICHETVTSCNGGGGGNTNIVNGKIIMETEIKITPETAVTMRILEQNPSTNTDESDDENGSKRIITDFSAPYPVTPMRPKCVEENNHVRFSSENSLSKNGRRVRFGGEIVKMRTPDSDAIDHSDENDPTSALKLPIKLQNDSDNSSISSDNSGTNEYIKQANVGFINEPLSLNTFRTNIDNLKEKKFEDSRRKPSIISNELSQPKPNSRPNSSFSRQDSSSSFTRIDPIPSRPGSSLGMRPTSSTSRPISAKPVKENFTNSNVIHSPTKNFNQSEPKGGSSSSSTTDYSQELTIGIPDVETVLPAHFTPPNIMIKKTTEQSYINQIRPATSPMVSPRIVTIPPTSSSSYSSKNNSPIKSAPSTPNIHSPARRNRPISPERTILRRSVSSLSPRAVHREVTMLHNLQRSPMISPSRSRRASVCSLEDGKSSRIEEATQTFNGNVSYNQMSSDMIQSSNNYNEINRNEINFGAKVGGGGVNSLETTPTSSKESPNIKNQQYKSWEELEIVDYFVIKDLKSGVSSGQLLTVFNALSIFVFATFFYFIDFPACS
ncbi:CLUMA_CG016008, isoform A [Clunio marinus]|uniref:CLUMA_CG016008, isoform A n=1 Tax=Clunio marinus TaxID=568069 RepID=A0A1J1IW45_9DIPT|nr:CLUMA_CG016008, isoform A [Clunio marinus]